VIAVATGLLRMMRWRVSATGLDHVPVEGAAVIATNHVSFLDFVFAGLAIVPRGRVIRFLAKKEAFDNPLSGALMRGMGHIPVDRYGSPRDALAPSIRALEGGEVIGIYPEGAINRSFVPTRGKTGAARMAMTAGVPLVPGVVWGGQRIWTAGRRPHLRRSILVTVSFGPPVPYLPDEDPAIVTERLMERIGEMAALAATGYPDRPRGPDDRWWLPAHLGGTAPTPEAALAAAELETRRQRERRRRS
jgi:1-acyl-sn-glycerol-3-phosphate acyltransferase